jgi:predicted glycoside hydrolase/deacetylase ChbG (UPF0249 family)
MAHDGARLDSLERLADACRWSGAAVALHLCFTEGSIASDFRALFVAALARPALLRAIAAAADAQAERLVARGVRVDAVNAHEHVHLFPPIWPLVVDLARRLGVRIVRAALGQRLRASRAGALAAASRACWRMRRLAHATVLSPFGVGDAGALTAASIERLLDAPLSRAPSLHREICMHPADDVPGRRAERDLLASGAVDAMLAKRGMRRAALLY